jgi:hypothetical protein
VTEVALNAAAALAPEPYPLLRTVRMRQPESGEVLELGVEISAPYRVSEDGLWACALRLRGLDDEAAMPHGRALFGVDGWQALSHAMKIAKATLEVAGRSYDLSWPDGTPFDPEEHL